MKAYRIEFLNSEWCTLIHGKTRGQAKSRFMRVQPDPWMSDSDYWTEIRTKRIRGLDNLPITYENSKNADFLYLDIDGEYLIPELFINDCDCEICKNIKQ